jgi:hypothetical protein
MVARAGKAADFGFLVHSHMMQHSTGYKSPTTGTTRTVLGFISNLAAVLRTLMPPTKGRKTRAGTSSLALLLTAARLGNALFCSRAFSTLGARFPTASAPNRGCICGIADYKDHYGGECNNDCLIIAVLPRVEGQG